MLLSPQAIGHDDKSGLTYLFGCTWQNTTSQTVTEKALAESVLHYIVALHPAASEKEWSLPDRRTSLFNCHPFRPDGRLEGCGYERGDVLTSNQGLFVLALDCAERMEFSLPRRFLKRAREEYAAICDPSLSYMRWLA